SSITFLKLIGTRIKRSESQNPLSPEHRLLFISRMFHAGNCMKFSCWKICSTLRNKRNMHSALGCPDASTASPANNSTMGKNLRVVDGNVLIQAPFHSDSIYFNYKKSFCLVLTATCNAYYRFTLIDTGTDRSNHDPAIFNATDSAVPLHLNIIRPYPGNNLGGEKQIFNCRLSRARHTIENTFGILVQRWKILQKPIVASINICQLIIQRQQLTRFGSKRKEILPHRFGTDLDENGDLHPGTWRE
ncbi:hypothetical protein NQ318_023642, partial [Aromia moschata]